LADQNADLTWKIPAAYLILTLAAEIAARLKAFS
jgi:hypothetical protein